MKDYKILGKDGTVLYEGNKFYPAIQHLFLSSENRIEYSGKIQKMLLKASLARQERLN